jgi:hypothetical protein
MLLASLVVGVAQAAPLSITNHSFEANQITGDGNTGTFSDDLQGGAPSGWSDTIGGWLTRESGSFFNDKVAPTPDSGDDASEQMVFSNGGSYLNQVLAAALAANTTYTLVVDIGDRTDTPFGGAEVRLGTGAGIGNNLLTATSSSTPAPADGNWATWTLEFVTGPAAAGLGQPLRIELHSNGTQALFDNVRLDAVTVPEPGTLVLFALGILSIVAARTTRRR